MTTRIYAAWVRHANTCLAFAVAGRGDRLLGKEPGRSPEVGAGALRAGRPGIKLTPRDLEKLNAQQSEVAALAATV